MLIVNVASRCVFTWQYSPLQALYDKYRAQGFTLLGFPCNQFAGQEPKSNQEIESFCSLTYNVSFPMFEKIEVNGANTHPLFAYLKSSAKGLLGSESIKWNFTKFLVDRQGQVTARFSLPQRRQALSNKPSNDCSETKGSVDGIEAYQRERTICTHWTAV